MSSKDKSEAIELHRRKRRSKPTKDDDSVAVQSTSPPSSSLEEGSGTTTEDDSLSDHHFSSVFSRLLRQNTDREHAQTKTTLSVLTATPPSSPSEE
ncbi:hypothetical protein F2Q69_00031215 [Brassica cretica]|uniref:Uncharacterized protein n=1 Tax=Brassica cretica TaxID=69181 RepID=A0A8S9RX94_BRACR|nr:hypothetical protein F2Q69_00031215 [Brassica cretica]